MKVIRIKEASVAGLGNDTVPAGYNQPGFGLGTATQAAAPNPDAQLAAASAAATPNGIDPLNKGYQLGGANDPLAEFEAALDNPTGLGIGGGKPPAPISTPGFPPMASTSFNEDGIAIGPDGKPVGTESVNPFAEDDALDEDGAADFIGVEAVPTFEDIGEDPALAALPVDADGIIQPIVIPDEIVIEPELGDIPDAALPMEEPIVDVTEDDVDIAIPENAFENDGLPEAIPVVESFKLPENQSIIVSKGDQIFMLGHVREEFTPKFAECVFSRALKSLSESKGVNGGTFRKVGGKHEKVAIVGRSMLVEVAKDWLLPGTSTVFEAHDLLQIVSARPLSEAEEEDKKEGESKDGKDGGKAEKSKKEDEVEKAKKEALLAFRRYKETAKKNGKKSEDDDDDDDDDDADDDDSGDDSDKAEKKAKKKRAKKEAAMLARQKTGGWI
jgi:hypothetical protein